MIATLMLASAYLAAPLAVDTVNFVHSYKKDQTATYELYISGEDQGMEAIGEFELAINSPLKKGKMSATFTFLKLDMDGNDMASMMPPLKFDLDKHGVPQKADEDDATLMAFVSLLTTYLPGESLDEGGKFKAKLAAEAFGYVGSGKFVGMKKKGGTNYAVLQSEGSLIVHGEEVAVEITTFYDAKNKRVALSDAALETPDGLFIIELKFIK